MLGQKHPVRRLVPVREPHWSHHRCQILESARVIHLLVASERVP